VGYLDFRRFQPPDIAGDTLVATMGFFANVDAFILDLTNCHGGSAFTVPYLAAYFFSRPTHLWDMEFRGDDVTEHYWTFQYVPGKRLAEVPMYILTSAYTFSGAEGFAYRFQVTKRATVVGERTGGGANAGGVRDIAPFFRAYLPMGRPIDSDTGTNWEGTGVEPDIPTSARDALAVAHIAALETLRAKTTDEKDQAFYDRTIRRVEADRDTIHLSSSELERFAGTYGPGRVWVEGGQLRYQRETRSPLLLTPLSPTAFYSEAEDPTYLEFLLHPDGRVDGLVFTDQAGRQEEFPIKR
jgi:C-terminal processing protease CtpA/Prc